MTTPMLARMIGHLRGAPHGIADYLDNRKSRTDKIRFARQLEWLAKKAKATGWYPPAWLRRQIARRLLGESFEVMIDESSVSASIEDRYYLLSLLDHSPDAFTAQLFKAAIKSGSVVCDIGAFVGYYTLLAARRVGATGKVYAFEPDPRSFEFLDLNIRNNRFADIVTAVPKALSNEAGEAPYYRVDWNRRRNSLVVRGADVAAGTVPSVTLDQFFSDGRERVDVIKMDIEGAEMRALEGMAQTVSRSPGLIMFAECHPHGLRVSGRTSKEFVERLEAIGFSVSIIDEGIQSLVPVDSRIDTAEFVYLYCRRGAIRK